MEAEKESLRQGYVRFQGSKRNSDGEASTEELAMRALMTEWLTAYSEDGRRFEIQFCRIVGNAFSREESSSFNSLQKAFEIFERICVNLLIFPWRKEFKRVNIFAPAFVHSVWPVMCKANVQQLLTTIGYSWGQEEEVYCYRGSAQSQYLKTLAFEFLLAQLECERLMETVSHVRTWGCNELETVKDNRQRTDGAMGCPGVREERKNRKLIPKPIKMNWSRQHLEQNYKGNLRKPNKPEALTSSRVYKHNTCFLSNSASTEIEASHRLLPSLRTASNFPANAGSELLFKPNKDGSYWRKTVHLESKPVNVCKGDLLERRKDSLPARLFYVEEKSLAASFLPCKCQICRASLGTFVCQRCGLAACTLCSAQTCGSVFSLCEHEFLSLSRTFPMDSY
ncbi:spermatogenesis-associated protein 2-like [Scyliorhinus canicula]|uniref:spermatogenesis-associated protein 2-like n=1 Tax=Scyliorhinus canicula TaxID=7830 RepID=UPI0018F74030|nr:spermatogenesis-associated protein 2-like [Scyliorhinus canicula]